jgi:putative copper resistance protein D
MEYRCPRWAPDEGAIHVHYQVLAMSASLLSHFIDFMLTFADLLALVCCLGALICRLWIVPTDGMVRRAPRILQLLTRIVGNSLAALAITSFALLWWRSTTLSGEPALKTLVMLPSIVTQTHVGHIWLIRAAAIASAVVLWTAARRDPTRNILWWMIFLAAAILAFSRSASGHAADAGDFTLKEWVDWTHLMAASVWVGSVLVVLLAVFPELARLEASDSKFIAQFANRFSRSSGIALGVVILAGTYNAWLRLGSFSALLDTPYGRMLDVKLLFVGLAIALGAINRFVHVRRVSAWAESTVVNSHQKNNGAISEQSRLVERFIHTVRVEGAVLLGVLLATAVLLQQMPPKMSMNMASTSHTQEFSFGEPAQPAQATRVVKIEATDEMRFKPDAITVRSGEIVRFDVTNTGKIRHEFVLGDEKEQREREEIMQAMKMKPGEAMPDEDNTISIAPGETKFITWRFPTKSGKVLYACHERGHYAAGMEGIILSSAVDTK